jgi:hypothetical protein
MSGTISWFEVRGRDAAKLRAFYQDLFDWTFQIDEGAGDYGVVGPEQSKVPGGVGQAGPEEMNGAGWSTFYVDVPSVEGSIEQALANGGKLLLPATTLPDTTIAVIADPEGHPVGLSGPA